MKRKYMLLNTAMVLCCITTASYGQTMTAIIENIGTKIQRIERNERTIEKVIYDNIYQSNDSKFFYEYKLYRSIPYTVTVTAESAKSASVLIKLYKYVNNDWQLAKQSLENGIEASLQVTPTESVWYKIEVSAVYKTGNTQSCFGLIIDRQQ